MRVTGWLAEARWNWRKEVEMKKVKCWKCNGLGKVPLELPRICIGAPGCPTHKKCDVCEGKGWNWE